MRDCRMSCNQISVRGWDVKQIDVFYFMRLACKHLKTLKDSMGNLIDSPYWCKCKRQDCFFEGCPYITKPKGEEALR